MEKDLYKRILSLLYQEVKPALGCTEPIAVAIAAARARAVYNDLKITNVEVNVSPNILKNAMGVGIPGTSLTGLPVAIALACVCGKYEYGLEVLKDVDDKSVEMAKSLTDCIEIGVSDSPKMLYAEAICHFEGGHSGKAIVADAHDAIVFVSRDGQTILDRQTSDSGDAPIEDDGKFLSLSTIYEFAQTAELSDLDIIREEIEMNTRLSSEGIKGNYGLNVGRTIISEKYDHVFGDNFASQAMAMTASASDARMAGCPLPAMSNSGSGNQGLTVSVPVIAAAGRLGSTDEELIRALVMSNLVAIHIKSYLGKLSALCGCVVASTGSSCGIIMLKKGTIAQMAYAIKNMVGSITGMVCDGAKPGCAMKVAAGVSCAIQSAVLAMDGICIQPTDGIIDKDVEKTIRNLGEVGSLGMLQTDKMILEIMRSK